jgi:cytosine/adenosine deaminase-related metal-dependent hydrolase
MTASHYPSAIPSSLGKLARACALRGRACWLVVVAAVAACAPPPKQPEPVTAWEPPAPELRYTRLEGGRPVGIATQRRAGDTIVQDLRDAEGTSVHETSLTVSAAGLPTTVRVREAAPPPGAPPVVEQGLEQGATGATWRDRTGTGALAAGAFYFPYSWNGLTLGLLARALATAPGRQLALAPMGEASLERAGSMVVDGPGGRLEVTQYRVGRVDAMPLPVWLDARGDLFATSDGWDALVREGYEAALPALERAQDEAAAPLRAALIALGHRPSALVIRDARVFDPVTLQIAEHTSVAIEGGRIRAVGPDAAIAAPAGAETLDAAGRFLMPGLWENHAHFWRDPNPLHYLMAGVTTVREMGNNDAVRAQVARIDAGDEVGPRVLMVRSVSRVGDTWWRANQAYADTPAEIEAFVDETARLGYVQIKARDIKPELVPVLVRAARARGLRVSGHVPAGMTARQFAEAGANEIQHLGFLARGFFAGEPDLTREQIRARFIAAMAQSPVAPEVRADIEVYARRSVAIDVTRLGPGPTTPPGDVPAEYRYLMGTGPLEMERYLPRNPVAADAWGANAALLRELHRSGVVVIPGTEGVDLAGFGLRAELESWVRAGIPAAEVLGLATYASARNMGRERELGTLAPGSHADIVLIDGDPTRDIADLRRVYRVIKGGTIYDPVALGRAVGMAWETP